MISRPRQWRAVLATGAVLVACANRRSGTVGLENLPPPEPAPSRYANRPTHPSAETAPETLSQALPVYPASALEAEIACTAHLLYHVEVDGTARVVRLVWDPAPDAEYLPVFEAAVREAVDAWTYKPATRLRWTEKPDGSLEFEGRKIPTAGRAIIRFRVEKGRGVVE